MFITTDWANPMIQNKMTSFRPLASIILSVFFLLVLGTPYVSADTKIGLDPERRPIKTWTDPVTGMAFVWAPGGSSRVIRGGYWYDLAEVVRRGFRDNYDPGVTYSYLGFRLVRVN